MSAPMFTRMQIARRRSQLAARAYSPARKVAKRICHRLKHVPCGYVCASRGDDDPIRITYGRVTRRTIFVMPNGEVVS